MTRFRRIEPVAEVPETMALFVNDKTTAQIRFPVLKGAEQEAKLTRLSWSLDAKARTLRVEIDLPNKEGKLRPGIYAHVTLRAPLAESLTLPIRAVVTQGAESVCFVVDKGKAVRTPLKTGVRGEDAIKHTYEDALKDTAGSPVNPVLQRQYIEVKRGHDTIRDMRDALKM